MLYYERPYLKEHTAKIIERKNNEILLDDTILYPGGGGQPKDQGVAICAGERVNIEHVGNGWHIVDRKCDGKLVHIKLDWGFRYKMMKMHTAEHAFFRFLQAHGAVLGKANFGEVSTITFTGELSVDDILEAERKTIELIKRGEEVSVFWIDKREASKIPELRIREDRIKGERVRVVKIGSHDITACKGIHVSNMSEIGDFAVLKYRTGKSKEIKFIVGVEAEAFHHEQSAHFRNILWSKNIEPKHALRFIDNLIQENEKMSKGIKAASEYVPFVEEPCNKGSIYSLQFYGAYRKIIVRRMMELIKQGAFAVIYGDLKNGSFSVAWTEHVQLRNIIIETVKEHGGKGGGSGNFFNGSVPDIVSFIDSLKKVLCSAALHLHGDENGD